MPRGRGRIRRITLEDGSLSFQVDAYDAWGRRTRRQFRDRADAEAFLAKLRHEKHLARLGVRPEKRAGAVITLSELFSRFLEWARARHCAHYLRQEVSLAQFFLDRLGDIPVGHVQSERIQSILQDLAQSHSSSTINRYYAFLRSVFNRAVEWDMLEVNPLARLHTFQESPGRVRYLTAQEAEALLEACRGHPKLFGFVILALYTGMRRGEIERLLWNDVDLEKGIIRVKDSKTRKARMIPIPKDLQRFLESLPHTSDYVLGPWGFKRSFCSACRRAGLQDFRFHDLRHTYASWKVMAGVDLRTVAELLGHRTLAMVMRYSHLSPDHLEKAREKGIMVSLWSVENGQEEIRTL